MHRLGRILLHHRDMFVSRRMKDNLGSLFSDKTVCAGPIPDITNMRGNILCRVAFKQLLFDMEQGRFGIVQQHDLRRGKPENLTTDFTPDTPGSPRNQNNLTAEVALDPARIKLNRPATEQIIRSTSRICWMLTFPSIRSEIPGRVLNNTPLF